MPDLKNGVLRDQATVEVPMVREFRFEPERRLLVLTARLPLAIDDIAIAVPFALAKHLGGVIISTEARAELASMGISVPGHGPKLT